MYLLFSFIISRKWKMRNAFVVLVSLCIGLANGYIVPSGNTKLPKFGVTLAETIAATLNAKGNSLNPILDSLPKTETIATLQTTLDDVNDEALYEHGQDKQNIVNERSFLFLNQKYKKPAQTQHHLSGVNCDIFDQSLQKEGADQLSGSPFKFSNNNYFEGPHEHIPNPNLGKKPSYFAPPHNCNLDEKGEKIPQKNGISNVQGDYLELLKEPILRPIKKQSQHKEKQILSSKAHQKHMDDGTKQYYILPKTAQENRLDGVVKNYGFKELEGVDTNFLNDNDDQNVLNSGGDEKLIDRFLKATMTEQEPRDRLKGKCKHNCVLKTTKRVSTPHDSMGHDADCKCGRWINLKPTIIKDTLQREKYKQYDTTVGSISAELSNYEKILQEPYSKSDNEIKKTACKFKNSHD